MPALPSSLFCLLQLGDRDAGGRAFCVELDLVADLHLLEHRRILDSEHHRHVVFVHIEFLELGCSFTEHVKVE